jgi:hypothetical protein
MNPVALAMSKRNDEKLLIDRVKKKSNTYALLWTSNQASTKAKWCRNTDNTRRSATK